MSISRDPRPQRQLGEIGPPKVSIMYDPAHEAAKVTATSFWTAPFNGRYGDNVRLPPTLQPLNGPCAFGHHQPS